MTAYLTDDELGQQTAWDTRESVGVATAAAPSDGGQSGKRKAPGYLAVAGASLTTPFRRHRKEG